MASCPGSSAWAYVDLAWPVAQPHAPYFDTLCMGVFHGYITVVQLSYDLLIYFESFLPFFLFN